MKNATLMATFDDDGREIANGGVYVDGNGIKKVGPSKEMPKEADRVIDAAGMVVMPGMVNTHHHFVQTLTRCMPGVQDAVLFDWLKRLYPVWANLTPEAVYLSTKTAMAELMLSGCTTSSDHNYIWPNGSRVDDQVRAAREMGMRFHVARGSMSVGESKGCVSEVPLSWCISVSFSFRSRDAAHAASTGRPLMSTSVGNMRPSERLALCEMASSSLPALRCVSIQFQSSQGSTESSALKG